PHPSLADERAKLPPPVQSAARLGRPASFLDKHLAVVRADAARMLETTVAGEAAAHRAAPHASTSFFRSHRIRSRSSAARSKSSPFAAFFMSFSRRTISFSRASGEAYSSAG